MLNAQCLMLNDLTIGKFRLRTILINSNNYKKSYNLNIRTVKHNDPLSLIARLNINQDSEEI